MDAELLAVVEVDRAERVTCQAPGCGHAVYKRIHVVRHDGLVRVYGSDCFDRLFRHITRASSPRYGSTIGRLLSADERQILAQNAEQLVARFEAEFQHAQERLRRHSRGARPLVQSVRTGAMFIARPSAARDVPAPGPTAAELAAVESEAKQLVRARYGVDPDAPGWQGLVMACQRELLAKLADTDALRERTSTMDGTGSRE